MDITAVNDLSYEEFVNIFGNVVEKCPIVAAAVWSERPFLSFSALEAAINEFIDILPPSGRNELTFFLNYRCVYICKCNAFDVTKPVYCRCAGKEGILRCHPDLAGRDLQRGTLTQESRAEQTAAGLDTLGSAEVSRIARLNEEYKQRFGFPFVVCVRLNDKGTILRQLTERCQNEPALEIVRGIEEVKKICRLRLQNIIYTPRL